MLQWIKCLFGRHNVLITLGKTEKQELSSIKVECMHCLKYIHNVVFGYTQNASNGVIKNEQIPEQAQASTEEPTKDGEAGSNEPSNTASVGGRESDVSTGSL